MQRFRYFLGGVGSGSLMGGLQIVLYPWLVTGVLGESAERVGFAQMAALLPALLFVLLGGALSENRHLGKLLFRLYLLYLVPYGLLLALAVGGNISYPLVVLFGFGYGLVTAFVQPARESLLPKVASEQLHRAVARAGLVQFGCQSIGMFCAGRLDQLGLEVLLAIQFIAVLAAAILLRRSFPDTESTPPSVDKQPSSGTISDGLKVVWRDSGLRHLMATVAATGFLGLGVYLVVLPLLAREIYSGGAAFFAWLQLTFTAGVIIANVLVIRGVGSRWAAGRFMLCSLLIRGLLLGLLAYGLPVWALFQVVLLWGLLSGWSMVLGRTMTHEMAPRSHRSRVVSVYQLSLFGAAPIGAWSCGQLIASMGLLPAVALFGSLAVIVSLLMIWRSKLW